MLAVPTRPTVALLICTILLSTSYLSRDKAPSNFLANKTKQVLAKRVFFSLKKNVFWLGLDQASMFDFPVVYGLTFQWSLYWRSHSSTFVDTNQKKLFKNFGFGKKYLVPFKVSDGHNSMIFF